MNDTGDMYIVCYVLGIATAVLAWILFTVVELNIKHRKSG